MISVLILSRLVSDIWWWRVQFHSIHSNQNIVKHRFYAWTGVGREVRTPGWSMLWGTKSSSLDQTTEHSHTTTTTTPTTTTTNHHHCTRQLSSVSSYSHYEAIDLHSLWLPLGLTSVTNDRCVPCVALVVSGAMSRATVASSMAREIMIIAGWGWTIREDGADNSYIILQSSFLHLVLHMNNTGRNTRIY